jgi:hypothetical protein
VLADATERIMAAITAQLESIRAEQAPAQRFDPRRSGIAEYGDPTSDRRSDSVTECNAAGEGT